ncbi:MAG: hypothetical protein QOF89_964 [Acidobacteriota bacterium]|jgi:hypothetical protein|nr:hypothetical protein [Acidobacteriota bacterium]
MESESWPTHWPRCQLLLELARQYTETGRTHGCHKLLARIEDWRSRMPMAPDLVFSFLSELCYATWLLSREEQGEARHHVAQAARKAQQIEVLLQRQRHLEARQRASHLRRQSAQLQDKVGDLLRRSQQLLVRSLAARGPLHPLYLVPRPAG